MPAKDKNKRYMRHSALCPYYKTTESMAIRCEGVNNTTVKIQFQSSSLRREHEDYFCCSHYRLCPYANLKR